MKKCPFCAEEIQDDAIKCRFCGEWFEEKPEPVEEDVEVPREEIESLEEKEITEGVEEEIPEEEEIKEDEIEDEKLEVEYPKPKEKVGWGWGWFVLLGLVISGISQVRPKTEYELTSGLLFFGETFLIIFLLFSYFKIRKKFILKNRYSAKWHASFVAGAISYIITLLLFIILLTGIYGIEKNRENEYSGRFLSYYTIELFDVNEEQIIIFEELIRNPSTDSEVNNNIDKLKEYLTLAERKRTLLIDMIQVLDKVILKRKDQDLNTKYLRFVSVVQEHYEKEKSAYLNLIQYYETDNEENLNQYRDLMVDVEEMGKEVQSFIEYLTNNFRSIEMEESDSTFFGYVFIILFFAYVLLYIYFSAKIFNQVGFSWPLVFLLFIPFVNLVFLVMLVIAVKRVLDEYGREWTWVLLLFIPFVNVIFLGMIALKKWPYDTLIPTEGITWIKKIKPLK